MISVLFQQALKPQDSSSAWSLLPSPLAPGCLPIISIVDTEKQHPGLLCVLIWFLFSLFLPVSILRVGGS